MTSKTIIAILTLSMIAASVIAAQALQPPTVDAHTPTDAEMEIDLGVLEILLEADYDAWSATGVYDSLRKLQSIQWMDWSQDGCSVENPAALGYADDFHLGCLRHDVMWRTLAVVDHGTGRVWNERNRYRADKRFQADNDAYCVATWGAPLFEDELAECGINAQIYYQAVRHLSGYRHTLTSTEKDSVDDEDHAMYDEGFRIADATSCSYSENSSNRCLPITYIQRNGNPFVPQNLNIIPTHTAIKLVAVRANLQSVHGPPSDRIPALLERRTPRNTGEIQIHVEAPYVIGKTPTLDCLNPSSNRSIDVDNNLNPPGTEDDELKNTVFYLQACNSTTTAALSEAKLELKPYQAKRTSSGYDVTTTNRVRHYQNMNAQTAKASISPRPDGLTLTTHGAWSEELTLSAVSPLTNVTLVANPNEHSPILEISRLETDRDFCDNGADTDDEFTLPTGSSLWLAMCDDGTGVLELRDPTTGNMVNTYVVSLSNPATERIISCTLDLVTSVGTTRSGTWDANDCRYSQDQERYTDYYPLQFSTTQEVELDLLSSTDAYLALYQGDDISATPFLTNDDGGTGRNAKITFRAVAGQRYTAAATTYRERHTGTYTFQVSQRYTYPPSLRPRPTPRPTPPPSPYPSTPSNLRSSPGNGQATLSWTPDSRATGHEIREWDFINREWMDPADMGHTATFSSNSVTVTGLENGYQYIHRVRSVRNTQGTQSTQSTTGTPSNYQSNWSANILSNPTVTLTKPTGFTSDNVTSTTTGNIASTQDGSLTLRWNEVPNALEYEVIQLDHTTRSFDYLPFRQSNRGQPFTITFNDDSAEVENLRENEFYTHMVRAKNGRITSPWSAMLTSLVPWNTP